MTEAVEFEFDHRDVKAAPAAAGAWARMREIPGIVRSPHHGGFAVVTRYSDICALERDPATFSSAAGTSLPAQDIDLIPIGVDPPQHYGYRRVLNAAFTPKQIGAGEPEVRALAKKLLAPLVEQHEFDYVAGFANPFPRLIALKLIGFSEADLDPISEWVHILVHEPDDREVHTAAGVSLMTRMYEFIEESRDRPDDGSLIRILLDAEVNGAPMTPDELAAYLSLLLFGGIDTTSIALAGMALHLAENPEIRPHLAADPELRRTAVEEYVRWTTPVQGQFRTVADPQGGEVAGCPVSAGEKVLLHFAAGNRDPEKFENPETIVLDRWPNHHLGFGMGPHRCLGAHLARLMIDVAISETIALFGDFAVADPAGIEWMAGETQGIVKLPLRIR